MRKNFGAKPITYPQPVFIIASYDETGKPDAMNAAWGGICGDKDFHVPERGSQDCQEYSEAQGVHSKHG